MDQSRDSKTFSGRYNDLNLPFPRMEPDSILYQTDRQQVDLLSKIMIYGIRKKDFGTGNWSEPIHVDAPVNTGKMGFILQFLKKRIDLFLREMRAKDARYCNVPLEQ